MEGQGLEERAAQERARLEREGEDTRHVFVYVRLEPVEYRLEAASDAEGLAVLEDRGGAAGDRRLVPVGVADESGVPFAFVLDEGVA